MYIILSIVLYMYTQQLYKKRYIQVYGKSVTVLYQL